MTIRISGTARRLLLAFGALAGLFAAASYVALSGLHEVHASLHELADIAEQASAGRPHPRLTALGEFGQHADAVQHSSFRWSLVLLGGATALAAAVGLYIGRSVARPVAKLEAGAARLAAGDLDARIDLDTPDEFGRLARQWNAMTEALKERQEKLVRSERLAGIGRLAAGVAHEINNPLAVILGYARLLRQKADGRLAEDLAAIEDEAVRCQEIVEELLDLARPARPGGGRSVEMGALCAEVVARLREGRALGEVAVEVVVAATGAVFTEGSAPKLRQVLMNLVRNAAEAAGPGGRVRVDVDVDGGPERGVAVSITDTGPGIGAGDRPHLFEPFFTTKPHGTGLGLAVSQAIALAHGGRIEVSEAAGGGAVFMLRLPGMVPAGTAARAAAVSATTSTTPAGGGT